MPIVQQGSINTTALIVPDLYVQIVPPQVALLNGVPTNVLGVVGTATWGPTNSPTICSNMADYARQFGSIQNRKYDMGTAVAVAVQQGANNFRCVRVTDGTDAAATATILTNCLTLTAKYTGTLGNSVSLTLAAGSASGTWKTTIAAPALAPEVFDNIGAGLSGNALWLAIAAAINNGNSVTRGPSQILTASAGVGVTAPSAGTTALSGGIDGATTISGTVLLGQDTVPRKGMYALRNSGASVAMLADCDDSTTWATQVTYGLSEGMYMIGVGPAGDTIANATSAKSTAGIDSYAFKLLFGDWVYWLDTVNGLTRLVSPQGFVAGLLANLSPQNSSLNKQIYGVIGTQKSLANQTYSSAELQSLIGAGIDVIANPVPGGSYFGCRSGHNSSSNSLTYGDNYTRMTNYIASTINAGMGKYVGQLQSATARAQAAATLSNFFSAMEQQGMIGAVNGGPSFSVQIDANNNPMNRVALGYMQADVKVVYLSVIEKFLVNVEGSQATVIRTSTSNQ
ncbi:putative phage tail sheath protein [Ralstonia solanacearum CMR15]|nr:putative phage tail sheath protein [Ralstonia solanacearum CMR15]